MESRVGVGLAKLLGLKEVRCCFSSSVGECVLEFRRWMLSDVVGFGIGDATVGVMDQSRFV